MKQNSKTHWSIAILSSFLLLFISTSNTVLVGDPILPATPYDYTSLNLPTHFTTNAGGPLPTSINGIDNTPASNPISNHGATLGRVLFYDKNLSLNRTISCGSCHKSATGFSDPSVKSVGFAGGTTRRHSMTLINALWYQRGRAFWDERAATIEAQVLMPFQDATEMGLTLTQLVDRINEQTYYNALFVNAFGDANVTSDRVSKALAQFVRSIVSYQSKYDVGRAQVANTGANFPNFTAQENQGKNLFLQPIPNGGGACFGCHTTEGFVSSNPGPQNNGIDAVSTTDLGAGETFPQVALFAGRFKTSTLRNIELTAPYMHDGRFSTLEQVVEHYNSGIQAHPTLSAALTDVNNNPVRLNWTTAQKAAVVAFMKTLTDNTLATNPKWADPFPTAVPVQLVDFSAKIEAQKAQLTWQTATEKDNAWFSIEKSLDTKSWTTIGTQKGAGFSQQKRNYEYWDNQLTEGVQFYRLKQTDFDGLSTYSKIISVKLAVAKNTAFLVYPNPVKNWLSISYDNFKTDKNTKLKIYNLTGQLILEKTINATESSAIDISMLANGTYLAHLEVAKQVMVQKFVKN